VAKGLAKAARHTRQRAGQGPPAERAAILGAMAKNRDVFRSDSAVARFVVSMWAARGDVQHTLSLVGPANDRDEPDFFYLVRLAMAQLFEAASALNHYKEQSAEVAEFLRKLPPDAQKDMKRAANIASQIGGKALQHSRDRTFHYPSPDPTYDPSTDHELETALRELEDEEAVVTFKRVGKDGVRARLDTADKAMLQMALSKHRRSELRKQAEQTVRGMEAFTAFAKALWDKYREQHDLSYPPELESSAS
jgi:hypothetical protein